MTVSYSAVVATTRLATLGRLLFRWKASVYKLLWREMLIYLALYISIAVIYRLVIDCESQWEFEQWAKLCRSNVQGIPLTFVLGFYVSLIVNRWWSMFENVGWPDRACFYISMAVTSNEKDSMLSTQFRRCIARYLNLAHLMVLRDVSTAAKERYPTLDKVVEEGIMSSEERKIYENVKSDNQLEQHHKYWLVIQWACNVLCRAYECGLVRDRYCFSKAFDEIVAFREQLGTTLGYDYISVPLSYTQVVTLVVYTYFLTTIVGRQYLMEVTCSANGTVTMPKQAFYGSVEMVFPFFAILEFLFFMGWLKVAESILNPLGQDDDDFEINYIFTRNLAVSYAIVDGYRHTCPPVKGEYEPNLAESDVKSKPLIGSAATYVPQTTDADKPKKGCEDDHLHSTECGIMPKVPADMQMKTTGVVSANIASDPTALLGHSILSKSTSQISRSVIPLDVEKNSVIMATKRSSSRRKTSKTSSKRSIRKK